MSIGAKIAGLSVVTLPVVGMTQFHYVVSHLSTIATCAAAITVSAAVWGGHAMIGKVKVRNEERKAAQAPTAQQSAADIIAAMHDALPPVPAQPAQPYAQAHARRVIDLGHVDR
jgi:hypothetical protein